jgi:hypothetical protein
MEARFPPSSRPACDALASKTGRHAVTIVRF